MIPEKSNKKWQEIIKDHKNLEIKSFSLKMLINNLRKSYELKMVKLDDAVDEIYQTCLKFENLYKDDLEKLFNS